MTDHRDDWPDRILETELESVAELDPPERRSAERIARDARNMNALLAAMAEQVGEGLPDVGDMASTADRQVVPLRRRSARGLRILAPLAAAAAVAALILARGDGVEDNGGSVAAARPTMVSEMDVEADGSFVVFSTSDPNIAVVWTLNLEESE